MREVLPYRTQDNRIEGVVVTFSDVAAEAVQEARVYAEGIVGTVREPLLVLDADLRVRSANEAFSRVFGISGESVSGRLVFELGERQWVGAAKHCWPLGCGVRLRLLASPREGLGGAPSTDRTSHQEVSSNE